MSNITTRRTDGTTDVATTEGFGGIDRLFDELFDGFFTRPTGGWMPAADVTEASDHVDIRLDLPGLERKDIEITMEDGVLSLSGLRQAHSREERMGYRRVERVSGKFFRRFNLPDGVNADEVSARSDHVVLDISIPTAPQAKSRRISVNVD